MGITKSIVTPTPRGSPEERTRTSAVAPICVGYELATQTDALRVPAVDSDGNLLGVVAVTNDRAGFCGTS